MADPEAVWFDEMGCMTAAVIDCVAAVRWTVHFMTHQKKSDNSFRSIIYNLNEQRDIGVTTASPLLTQQQPTHNQNNRTMFTVNVAFKNTARSWAVEESEFTAAKLTELIKSTFNIEGDIPIVTYVDDEQDEIKLNLGVSVEFDEALRVLQCTDTPSVLNFSVVNATGVKYVKPTRVTPTPKRVKVKAQPVVAATKSAQTEQAAPASAPAAPASDALMGQIGELVRAHTTALTKASEECAKALEEEVQRAKTYAQEQEAAAAAARDEAACARREAGAVRDALEAAEKDCQSLRSERDALTAECSDLKTKHEQATAKIGSLVDTVAGHREELATKQLQIKDLRAELDAVYSKIASLLPDIKPPKNDFEKAVETVAKGVESFTDQVEAVFVAAKEEIKEAVELTNSAEPRSRSCSAGSKSETTATATVGCGGGGSAPTSSIVLMMDQKSQKQYSEEVQEAYRKIRNMGFDASLEDVGKAMARCNNDVAAVISKLFL